ncbi:ComEC/Rec2 family competence protein [Acidithiobacillus sp. CV18-2]|uniref:ComEC/Rec2 family competence protein n=1 Tax=Igneacidithiobacillus copahuensis TaxID=2724909 RepID=A0AAE2YPT3_9PROT|nr:ComEC/Rec2 family competence protein [Igneacidithiobacillus copahuensis]MBU2755070.1 ComEC/Rec2 family competence protein [Acidithiobacillus sp. CV18-3]MBU2756631.1 ComEC/Rec2 family competence protein [Acidithiobacillus sp. BN09-2]MBU2777650.1 ComEC/Rec2 family competence protein [Acidithiobacillus sp. CV18-2]MBU2796569.1 ComEC/Rec2 family competence protein [Acidithiobacillus sp. VAN18-2]MBU2800645.1 ComEC/Rec2 family competence protein [Acidithiobacillus sp. VAN18-4]UTV81248.1 ComEC/Rec
MRAGAKGILSGQRGLSLASLARWSKSWPGLLAVSLALLVGVILFQSFTVLPAQLPVGLALLLFLLLGWRWHQALLPAAVALAFLIAGLQARHLLERVLPAGQSLTITGRIADIPQEQRGQWRLHLVPERSEPAALMARIPSLIELHGALPEAPVTGQRWRLEIRSESLQTLRHSAFVDLPRQRFWQGLLGAGKIVSATPLPASSWHPLDLLAQWRSRVAQASNAALPRVWAGYVQALTVGIGNQLPPSVWQIYRDTGTAHLLVISGSHVAVITGFFLWLWRSLWRRVPALVRRWPAQQAALLAAIPVAWTYAYLAGMQSPGERAAWMITAASVAALLGRRHAAWSGLAFSAAMMAVLDPGQVIDLGYWLSILAVAVLISLGMEEGQWRQALAAQWRVSILLLPLLAFLFGSISLISPLANLLVIPLIELLAVPLALLGAAFSLLDWELGYRLLFRLVALEMQAVTALLDWLRHWPWALLTVTPGRFWAALASAILFALLLLPRYWPGRNLAYLGFVPLLAPGPVPDGFRLEELPVGKGMALFWHSGRETGLYTANLWHRPDQRALTPLLAAQLQKSGQSRLRVWVLGDLSLPQPLPAATESLIPLGNRLGAADRPLGACAEGVIPGGRVLHFAPVQPCVLSLDAGRVLILGDMDEATEKRFFAAHFAIAPKLIFAPYTWDVWQRHALLHQYPYASIRYLGEDPGPPWHWQGGSLHLPQAARPRPYWELA